MTVRIDNLAYTSLQVEQFELEEKPVGWLAVMIRNELLIIEMRHFH